ncbi:MAG: class I SAM-dependent methyltransferase [Akkermansiaceae bacterium]|nr:class I SAM-dependent methyltransferase [Akkermansiaceae bacterium]
MVPSKLWNFLGATRRNWISRNDHKLSTREVFSKIYEKRLWSGDERYSSGDGSRTDSVVNPYVEAISKWARANEATNLHAVDLGCGDFHIGRRIYSEFGRYTGVDIVPALIENHRQTYLDQRLQFSCLDAIEEELPSGDVILVRQVLQHLSNAQISAILPKIAKFKFAIITEHHPAPEDLHVKNYDKPHGGGIRLAAGSGVYLDSPPFSLPFVSQDILLDVASNPKKPSAGRIVTTVYTFQ